MSGQDPENQPADSSQQADAHRDAHHAEVAQTHLDDSLFLIWFRSFRQHTEFRKAKLEPKDGYTTHSFNSLKRPLPVEDFLFSARTLITLRLICQGIILSCAGYIFINISMGLGWWLFTLAALAFQLLGIHGVGGVGIPTVQQLWSFDRYPQRFWVCQLKLLTNSC
jgi:hypothetical protein